MKSAADAYALVTHEQAVRGSDGDAGKAPALAASASAAPTGRDGTSFAAMNAARVDSGAPRSTGRHPASLRDRFGTPSTTRGP